MISSKTNLTIIIPGRLAECDFGPGSQDNAAKVTDDRAGIVVLNTRFVCRNHTKKVFIKVCNMCTLRLWLHRFYLCKFKGTEDPYINIERAAANCEWSRRKGLRYYAFCDFVKRFRPRV